MEDKTRRLREILSGKAREYRSLVMIGRTNDQQAMPITLGFKISTWIDELDRCLERMEQAGNGSLWGSLPGPWAPWLPWSRKAPGCRSSC